LRAKSPLPCVSIVRWKRPPCGAQFVVTSERKSPVPVTIQFDPKAPLSKFSKNGIEAKFITRAWISRRCPTWVVMLEKTTEPGSFLQEGCSRRSPNTQPHSWQPVREGSRRGTHRQPWLRAGGYPTQRVGSVVWSTDTSCSSGTMALPPAHSRRMESKEGSTVHPASRKASWTEVLELGGELALKPRPRLANALHSSLKSAPSLFTKIR